MNQRSKGREKEIQAHNKGNNNRFIQVSESVLEENMEAFEELAK